jgi:hypothetical protein
MCHCLYVRNDYSLTHAVLLTDLDMFSNRLLGIHGWEMPLKDYSTFEIVSPRLPNTFSQAH